MARRIIHCFIGNYDGKRDGMIYAASKQEAAKVARCSVYHFERYWHADMPWHLVAPKVNTLYTRKNDFRSKWQEGICPIEESTP